MMRPSEFWNRKFNEWTLPMAAFGILVVVVLVGVILALVFAGCSAGRYSPAEPEQCGDSRGTWIEDDNNWMTAETHVTVRICVDDGGNVLDLEVD